MISLLEIGLILYTLSNLFRPNIFKFCRLKPTKNAKLIFQFLFLMESHNLIERFTMLDYKCVIGKYVEYERKCYVRHVVTQLWFPSLMNTVVVK